MPVLGAVSVTLEVPSLEEGLRFYTDAGLVAEVDGGTARLRCLGQVGASIELRGGASKKRLHHITLRADELEQISERVARCGGRLIEPPDGCDAGGLWLADPHGMVIHLVDLPAEPEPAAVEPFRINAPGAILRKGSSAMRPAASYPPAFPRRLGHLLVFTPDVLASVAFMTDCLGMGLADHAGDVIAFCCVRRDSDHHVVAFAKSPGIGFHHASFQVADPDEVGRGGHDLAAKAGRGDWGVGRHTIGSNFFHYVQDPWGSWFEYYSDMDHIEDHDVWKSTDYAMEDSLANWGPKVPDDFVHNYEVGAEYRD